MKKLSAIIMMLLMPLTALAVTAIELEPVESGAIWGEAIELEPVESGAIWGEAVVQSESAMPEKYNSTYGELVMYSDFSGESVATPTYSSSNLVINALASGIAPDGTVCAVTSSNISGAKGIEVKTSDSGVFAYED